MTVEMRGEELEWKAEERAKCGREELAEKKTENEGETEISEARRGKQARGTCNEEGERKKNIEMIERDNK